MKSPKIIRFLFIFTFFLSCVPAKQIPIETVEPKIEKPTKLIEIISENTEIYGIPGQDISIAGVLTPGAVVEVTSENDLWFGIKKEDGASGWIKKANAAIPAKFDLGIDNWRPITGTSHLQVAKDKAAIRSEGSVVSDVVETAIKGTKLFIYDKKGDWFHIELPDKTEGWICAYFVEPYQSNDLTIGKHFKAREDCPMYSGAGEDHEKLGMLWALKQVVKVNQQNDWFQVRLPDETIGWVHKSHLKQLD